MSDETALPETKRKAPRKRTAYDIGLSVWRWLPTLGFIAAALWLLGWFLWEEVTIRYAVYNIKSDYWEHAAVLRELMDHPFSPGNPHLATDETSPRYMPHFVVLALVGRAFSMSAFDAMSLASLTNLLLMVVGTYWFFRSYFRDHRAPLYGLIVVTCSWYSGFNYSNVLQLRMLLEVAAYPSTAAYAYSLISLAVLTRVLRGKWSIPWLVVLGLSAWNVLLTHPLTAVMGGAGLGLLTLTEPDVSWKKRLVIVGVLVASAIAVELWPYFSVTTTLLGGEAMSDSWVADGADQLVDGETRRKPHRFYSFFQLGRTIGFAVVGVYALPLFVAARKHLFIVLGAALMLAPFIANVFVEIPLGHRFVLLAVYFVQFAVVWMLLKASPGFHEPWPWLTRARWRGLISTSLVYAFLATLVWFNVPLLMKRANKRVDDDAKPAELCLEVAEKAGPDAVVFSYVTTSWPLPACGPKVHVLKHRNPFVSDRKERAAQSKAILQGRMRPKQIRKVFEKHQVTHVLVRRPRGTLSQYLKANAKGQRIQHGYRLYRLKRK